MSKKYFAKPLWVIFITAIMAVSCSDQWDEHFYPTLDGKSTLTTFEYIKTREDLSIFAQMLEKYGYDKLLSTSQTYTVWAPTNASLAGIDLNNELLVKRIVQNHITQFSIATVGAKTAPFTMLNGKLLPFEKASPGFGFGGTSVLETDLAMKNGVVHVIGEYVPYKLNVWEFMDETPGLDSVKNYVQSLTKMVYDPEASYNSEGVFVDSVFYEYNPVLYKLCRMKSEDSTYTAVFPGNAAWSEKYAQIFPYFKTIPASGGVATQVANTKWTLVQDLFYNSRLEYPVIADSAYLTTNENSITNLNEVLAENQVHELSNGLAYTTNSLKYKAVDSWHKEIRVEAETIVGVDSLKSNYNLSYTTAVGSSMNVSERGYLTAVPATTSSLSRLWAKFPIPNTLSAKYNVYCVFVPTKIVDEADLRPYKVNFYLTYRDATGKIIKDSPVTVASNITDPNNITKMLVLQNYQFPFSNIVGSGDADDVDAPKEVTSVLLRVENAATTRETATYNRTIRIDCVILEPVQ